jgi:LysM repeat protein
LFKPIPLEAHEPLKVVTVIAEKGDSLWKIAEKYDNNHMDLRQYIDIIQDYNKLDDTLLQPGQHLLVPIYTEI